MGKPIRFLAPLAAATGVAFALLLADLGSPAGVRAQSTQVCPGEPPAQIIGSPLDIVANGQGQVQVGHEEGQNDYGCEFFPSNDDSDPEAGLNIANYDLSGEFLEVYGYRGEEPFSNVSGPTLGGDTDCNPGPCTLTSVYTSAGGSEQIELTITEVHSYVNGNTFFDTRYTIENTSTAYPAPPAPTVRFRATVSADLCLGGSDDGVGTQSSGPPRFVGAIPDLDGPGCFSEPPCTECASRGFQLQQMLAGYAGGFEQVSPWTRWEEDTTTEIVDKIENPDPDGGFDNTVNGSVHDTMVGIQFDDYLDSGLADDDLPTPPAVFDVRWHLRRPLSTGGDGGPPPQLPGSLCGSFPFPPCAGGGGGGGGDGAGGADADPVFGESFNIKRLSGECSANTPGSGGPMPIENVETIPDGTIVNCRFGAALLYAALPGGGIQWIRVWDGQFKVTYLPSGIVVLKLAGPFSGPPIANASSAGGEPIATAARRRGSRSLFARSTGRFRTKGRVASATVRGTTWRMIDSRFGTYAKVLKGKGVRLCTLQRPRRCFVLGRGQSRLVLARR
jgi:hypothetical protein